LYQAYIQNLQRTDAVVQLFGGLKSILVHVGVSLDAICPGSTHFCTMAAKLPVKNLIRLSCWLSVLYTLMLLLSFLAEHDNITLLSILKGGVPAIASVFITAISISYLNIGLIVLRQHNYSRIVWPAMLPRILVAVLLGAAVIYLVHLPDGWLVRQGWLAESVVIKGTFSGIMVRYIVQSAGITLLIRLWLIYIVIQDTNNKAEIENSQLKVRRTEAEYQLLKQQIHPHFLFNALNIVKSPIRLSPDDAEEYVIHLSNFLRAAVSSNQNMPSPLHEEIQLGRDYLEMQKIRFGTALEYRINVPAESPQGGFILSFSLLPLLENAIKHNELTRESPLYVEINQKDDRIKASNNIQRKRYREPSTGVGLSNLIERYMLWSGDEVIVREEDEGRQFAVSIKITKYANSHFGR
jgi:two-component system, LytTR family, sensor kinase